MDDATLWKRWQAGRDADAFAEIVSRHAAMVHAASRRVLRSATDAEDIAQECFLELLRLGPTVHSSLGALLHTLAVRRSLDRLKADRRRQDRERLATERRQAEHRAQVDPPVDRAEVADLLARVDEAIDELPESLRGPIVLRFLEDRTSTEAAAWLKIPESTLRLRVEKGVARVRSALKRRGIVATEAALLAALTDDALAAVPRTLIAALGKVALAGGAQPGAAAAAAARRTVRPATVLTGALLMKKKVLIAAALLLVAAGAVAHRALDSNPARPARAPEPVPAPPLARREPVPVAEPGAHDVIAVDRGSPLPEDVPERWIDVVALEGGAPAAGAEVFLVERRSRSAADEAAAISHGPRTTDEQGHLRFGGLPSREGVWRFEVFARVRGRLAGIAGKQSGEMYDHVGAAGLLMVTLLPAARLQGTVDVPAGYDPLQVTVRVVGIGVRDANEPFAESLEAAAEGPLARALEVRPGEDGTFAFDDLPATATVRLEADAPGLARAATVWEGDAVKLRLVSEGALEGTVRFADTGRPAADVRLEAQPLLETVWAYDGSFRVASGADGGFRFAKLPAGSYSLSLPPAAEASDWTLRVAGPFLVTAGETTGDIDLRLERGGTVSGRVLDASSGAPVPGISIAAHGPAETGKRPLGGAVAEATGRYSFRLPPGQSTLYVASEVPEYVYPAEQGRRDVTLAAGEEMGGVDFHLEPRTEPEPPIEVGRARGRVLDSAGRALARVRVFTATLHDPARPVLGLYNQKVWTDREGRYEALVPAGPLVYVQAGGGPHSAAAAKPFTVTKGEEHAVEDLVVRLAEGVIEGQVLGPGGAPLEGAAVRASSPNKPHDGEPARTDGTGRFRLERLLADEPLEVTVAKAGYATLRTEGLRSGAPGLRLILEPAAEEPDAGAR